MPRRDGFGKNGFGEVVINMTTMELFLHGKGRPQVISAGLDESVRALLARLDALPGDGEFVFIGEFDEAILDPEALEDGHLAADLDLTVEQAELHRFKHIHSRAVHRVEVTVFFNGVHHERKFSPTATVATATEWAKKRFKIDPVAGANLVLALRPGGTYPRPNEHLGELLEPCSHSLTFDLVSEMTPQG